MDWKTTDEPGYRPRSVWNSDAIPDLSCLRGAATQQTGARSAPAGEHTEVWKTVLSVIARFPDAKRAVLDAVGPCTPDLAA